ncbi:MAG: hypothetical protein R3D02_05185 [Hyphomicrobiales bacterium]
MPREAFIFAIVALAIVNGIFSPLLPQAIGIVLVMAPAFFIGSPQVLFLLASLLLSTATIMLAGVPAALFERATGRAGTDGAAFAVWLAATAVLALPGLIVAFRLAG